ncbi:ATP-binding cassette domain-containing protein [Erwinia sp. CPCC 100877]|nr:ATP-binding cassette domain-containing protein [Erwinia sp. CPCC 100877]
MAYLTIKNLTFQYAGASHAALKQLSFSVEKGAFHLICGASGSGKSTLLKLLKPQLTPAGEKRGTITLAGAPLSDFPAAQIGYVMQNPESQLITTTVWQELAFGLENERVPSTEIKRRIAEMVSFLGIEDLLERQTATLSGGQKQLVNLAAVLVMRPAILLLDEPVTQLDPLVAQSFMDMLVRLNREMGMTILLVEQQLESLFSVADHVLLLAKGQLVYADTPFGLVAEVKEQAPNFREFILSLPSAAQLYLGLDFEEECPLTVTQGQRFLRRHFIKETTEDSAITTEQLSSKDRISLQLKNCWFRYEKTDSDILAGVNLTLKAGEIFTLVGGNGSGKTTLLKMIAGILTCYRGKAQVFGAPLKKAQSYIGYLPQASQLVFIKETVAEDYHTYLANQGWDQVKSQQRIDEITRLLDLEKSLMQHPFDLSGGECQRAAIGKLLLTEPEILLLDEPTQGLDNFTKKQLIELLQQFARNGKTILAVTHDLDFAAELSDRCGLFFDNTVLAQAPPKEFFSEHAFYTTTASRISRVVFNGLVTTREVIEHCKEAREAR